MTFQKEKSNTNALNSMSDEQKWSTYRERIKYFEEYAHPMPIQTNHILNSKLLGEKKHQSQIIKHMQSAHHILHAGTLSLMHRFLLIKKKYGTSVEKAVYANMNEVGLMDRLATKRCIMFFQSYDAYILRDGFNSSGNWERVGTKDETLGEEQLSNNQKKPVLKNYLSYDELLISSLCGLSSETHFINEGHRNNCGRIASNEDGSWPRTGVYTGLVGARFEKSGVMEHLLLQITEDQNTIAKGFGHHKIDVVEPQTNHQKSVKFAKEGFIATDIEFMKYVDECVAYNPTLKPLSIAFEEFYSRPYFPTYKQTHYLYTSARKGNIAPKNKKGHNVGGIQQSNSILQRYYQRKAWSTAYLDMEMYDRRIRISLELFLFDANERARIRAEEMGGDDESKNNSLSQQKKNYKFNSPKRGAFCHIVGLGTGVWAFKRDLQDRRIVRVVKSIIKETHLPFIDYIHFAWMHRECNKDIPMSMVNSSGYGFTKKMIFEKDQAENFAIRDKSDSHTIGINFSRRSPADMLPPMYKECLLCCMYAWDSNAFPGNEYWQSMLAASGDPAAAACSTLPFVQNSMINQEYITGKNTMVYFYNNVNGNYECETLDKVVSGQKWFEKATYSTPYRRVKLYARKLKQETNNPLITTEPSVQGLSSRDVFSST